MKRHGGSNIKAEASEPNVLGFVPTEEPHFADAQLAQDLSPYANIAITGPHREAGL
jgi:hypothetical protein